MSVNLSDAELAEASKCRRTVSVCAPSKRCKAGTLRLLPLKLTPIWTRSRAIRGGHVWTSFSPLPCEDAHSPANVGLWTCEPGSRGSASVPRNNGSCSFQRSMPKRATPADYSTFAPSIQTCTPFFSASMHRPRHCLETTIQ